jgi:hypothetical protein
VLLTDPDRAVGDDEVAAVQRYRKQLELNFATATGHCGSLITDAPVPPVIVATPKQRVRAVRP